MDDIRPAPALTQVPLARLDGLDLLPLAVFACPLSHFTATGGIRFAEDCDDLDQYAIAALDLAGIFALRAYRGAPSGTVDLLLPAALPGHEIVARVKAIARALHVPAERIAFPDAARAA